MNFNYDLVINAPIQKVVDLFENEGNLDKWQEGFISIKHIGGEPGTPGAVSRITFRSKGRVMELTETIRVKNLPEESTALYEHEHMSNTMSYRFIPVDDYRTKMIASMEYIKFHTLIPRILSFLNPGMFTRPAEKWLNNFKAFVEREY
jgi:hypothetical protein